MTIFLDSNRRRSQTISVFADDRAIPNDCRRVLVSIALRIEAGRPVVSPEVRFGTVQFGDSVLVVVVTTIPALVVIGTIFVGIPTDGPTGQVHARNHGL